jgi:hypothetical protein
MTADHSLEEKTMGGTGSLKETRFLLASGRLLFGFVFEEALDRLLIPLQIAAAIKQAGDVEDWQADEDNVAGQHVEERVGGVEGNRERHK